MESDVSINHKMDDICFGEDSEGTHATSINQLPIRCNEDVASNQSTVKDSSPATKDLNKSGENESLPAEKSLKIATSRSKRKLSKVCYNENFLSVPQTVMPKKKSKGKSTKTKKLTKEGDNRCCQKLFSQAHFNDMFTGFYKLQKTGKYCDVRLCADTGCILVHSLVIITASPYFLKEFKNLPKVDSNTEPIKSLMLSDIPYWAVEKLVTFLYSGETEVDQELVEEFNNYCLTLGITGLEWKSASDDKLELDVPETKNFKKVDIPKIKSIDKKVNKVKVTGAKNKKGDTVVDSKSRKPKKRKLSDAITKLSEKGVKKPKKVKPSDREIGAKVDNLVIKVETSTNSFEVLDKNVKSTNDDATDNCYNAVFDVDSVIGCADDANDDFADSGGDTDSYFENELVERNGTEERTEDLVEGIGFKTLEMCTVKKSSLNVSCVKPLDVETVTALSKNEKSCDKCGRSYIFQNELTAHRSRCNGKNNRQRKKCTTCMLVFDNTEDYVWHRNTDKVCLAMRQERQIKRKQRRLENRKKFGCCVCSRKFKRVADKIEHEFSAHEIKYDKEQWPDLYCEFCNFWSMNPWKLHNHKLVSCSKGQEPICDMCGNSYKNEKTLQKHKERMHTDIQPMLTCEECGKLLKGKKGLKHHIRIKHRGENLHNIHMCHICSRRYRTGKDLAFHLYKLHDQPLPEGYVVYQCDMCDYEHNNKRFYEKHLLLHDDKREWHCDVCSKAFKTKNSLNTHRTIHSSERISCPFEDCTYKALKKSHLKNHIENQHTQKGEKRERCQHCDYSTFFKGNLIKHQRSVHKLEIVTRHSVEMKAKYKNLKSGQIVGIEEEEQGCDLTCDPTCVPTCVPTCDTSCDTASLLLSGQRETTNDGVTDAVSVPYRITYPVISSSDNNIADNSKIDNLIIDNARIDHSRIDNIRIDNSIIDHPRIDNSRIDNSRIDNSRMDNSRVDNLRVENIRIDHPRIDNPNPRIDDPRHIEEKSMLPVPHNAVDPLVYTPMFPRHANIPTAMYGVPPIDFLTYHTGSTMHQM